MEEKEKKSASATALRETVEQFIADTKEYVKKEEGEIIIRLGDAPPILDFEPVIIVGEIDAPSTFFSHRKSLHDPKKCNVTINRLDRLIVLSMDETSPNGPQISGRLQLNPELEAFEINKGRSKSIKDLLTLLKFNRIWFEDKDENNAIVVSLEMFKAKVAKEIEATNDNKGKSTNVNNFALEHAIKDQFVLNIPIYKGQPATTFVVQICISATDGGVLVWLESRELKELEISQRDRILKEEADKFSGIAVLYI